MCPRIYASDQAKVALVISLLIRDVLDWASPVLEDHRLVLSNWVAFLQLISIIFNDPP